MNSLVNYLLESGISLTLFALSFLLFFVHLPFLLYLGNGIVDGGIGIVALIIFLKKKRAKR